MWDFFKKNTLAAFWGRKQDSGCHKFFY